MLYHVLLGKKKIRGAIFMLAFLVTSDLYISCLSNKAAFIYCDLQAFYNSWVSLWKETEGTKVKMLYYQWHTG